jgi:thiosulfate reductase cytochrome b subunit
MARQTKAESDEVRLAVMANDVKYIKDEVIEIKKRMDCDFVTRQEFDPVKKIVYGIVTTVLMTVLGALLALVILK